MDDLDVGINEVIIISSDDDNELERRRLVTEVEMWSRTGYRYTTYRENEPIWVNVVYEDEFHRYTMKQ